MKRRGILRLLKRALRVSALCLCLIPGYSLVMTADANAAENLSPDQKKSFERLIRQYLLENPEIIAEAMAALKKKQELAEVQATKAALRSQKNALLNDPGSPIAGNINGDVTVVEFFDYRCGVCKRVHPIVDTLMKGDRKLRRVYKEWPILGPESDYAARAALASRLQGKYLAFHNAMMTARGRLDKNSVLKIAKRVGIDVQRLARDLNSAEVSKILQRNFELAEKLNLNGTPSFVIGDVLLKGGRDLETMRKIVADIRAGN